MENKTPTQSTESSSQASTPNFHIHKLYMKDASFVTHSEVADFSQAWKPELQVEINSKYEQLPQDKTYEVVLHVKCVVSSHEKKTFEVETDYAGIFTIQNVDGEQLQHTLGSYCPSLLYPYLREVIADLVLKGGFPQLNLAPINFDLLFEQQKKSVVH
jgi:preprotein translocase subunit SecB